MNKISISEARQILPELIQRAFQGEEIVVTKNKITMAKIGPVNGPTKQKKVKRIFPKEAIGLFDHLKGSTIEIADKLRKEAWEGNYGD